MYGYHFIPFADVPHVFFITPAHDSPVSRMLKNCQGMYVLIIMCLLATVVSGWLVWFIETLFRNNRQERQPFFRGVFEGMKSINFLKILLPPTYVMEREGIFVIQHFLAVIKSSSEQGAWNGAVEA